jgi:hypothetical protein
VAGQNLHLVRESARVYSENLLQFAEACSLPQEQYVQDLKVPFLRQQLEAFFEALYGFSQVFQAQFLCFEYLSKRLLYSAEIVLHA